VIIPDRPFQGKRAHLRTTAEGEWVRIEDETDFCVDKQGKIKFDIEYSERDLRHVYDLLNNPE